jgi:hypothetical protein
MRGNAKIIWRIYGGILLGISGDIRNPPEGGIPEGYRNERQSIAAFYFIDRRKE